MVSISIKSDMEALLKDIQAEQKRIRMSAAIALTKTAKAAQSELKAEMPKVFDKPTAYTLNSTYVKTASPGKLRAEVGIKDQSWAGKGTSPIKFLAPQIYGGERGLKRFEKALQARGLLPNGMYAMPGEAARIDRNGNMSAGQIRQIMSALGVAERSAGYSANRTKRSSARNKKQANYFVGRPGNGKAPLGIWQVFRFAHGSAVKPVVIFTKQPHYRSRFQFHAIVERVVDRDFDRFFASEFKRK